MKSLCSNTVARYYKKNQIKYIAASHSFLKKTTHARAIGDKQQVVAKKITESIVQ